MLDYAARYKFHMCVYVATHLRCSGMFNNHFITNFFYKMCQLQNWKSANIWQRWTTVCGLIFSTTLFGNKENVEKNTNYTAPKQT